MEPKSNYEATGQAQMKEGWHLDKKVPLSIILAIGIQTTVLFMWGARLDQRVSQVEGVTGNHTIIIETMRSNQSDTKATLARMDERLASTAEGVKEIKSKLDILNAPTTATRKH